ADGARVLDDGDAAAREHRLVLARRPRARRAVRHAARPACARDGAVRLGRRAPVPADPRVPGVAAGAGHGRARRAVRIRAVLDRRHLRGAYRPALGPDGHERDPVAEDVPAPARDAAPLPRDLMAKTRLSNPTAERALFTRRALVAIVLVLLMSGALGAQLVNL